MNFGEKKEIKFKVAVFAFNILNSFYFCLRFNGIICSKLMKLCQVSNRSELAHGMVIRLQAQTLEFYSRQESYIYLGFTAIDGLVC